MSFVLYYRRWAVYIFCCGKGNSLITIKSSVIDSNDRNERFFTVILVLYVHVSVKKMKYKILESNTRPYFQQWK